MLAKAAMNRSLHLSLALLLLGFPASAPLLLSAQAVSPRASATQSAPGSQGVMATGAAAAPVFDAEKRPITAGGFVDSGPIVFYDIAEKARLTRAPHHGGGRTRNGHRRLKTNSGGRRSRKTRRNRAGTPGICLRGTRDGPFLRSSE